MGLPIVAKLLVLSITKKVAVYIVARVSGGRGTRRSAALAPTIPPVIPTAVRQTYGFVRLYRRLLEANRAVAPSKGVELQARGALRFAFRLPGLLLQQFRRIRS